MLWMILGVALALLLFSWLAIRPMINRRRKYDAGTVSEYWIQQHRGRSQDVSR